MIVGISVVKNEADVIEAMIRHNLGFLDHILVIDNGSTDPTPAILTQLAAELDGCTLQDDPGIDHRQHEILTARLPHLVEAHGATHIVPLDADEFLKGDPAAFREELTRAEGVVSYPWVTYVPQPDDNLKEAHVLRRIRHRRRREVPLFRKATVPAAMVGDVTLGPGSHAVLRGGRKLPATQSAVVELGHFPVRSKEQLMSKVLLGAWAVRLRNRAKPDAKEAHQWIDLAHEIRQTGTIETAAFYDLAHTYAARRAVKLILDPIPSSDVLHYSEPSSDTQLLRNVMSYTEALISSLEHEAQT